MKQEVSFFRAHGPTRAIKVWNDILADQVLERFLNWLRLIHKEDLKHDAHQGIASTYEWGLTRHLIFGVRIHPKVIFQIRQDLFGTQSDLDRDILNASQDYLRFDWLLLVIALFSLSLKLLFDLENRPSCVFGILRHIIRGLMLLFLSRLLWRKVSLWILWLNTLVRKQTLVLNASILEVHVEKLLFNLFQLLSQDKIQRALIKHLVLMILLRVFHGERWHILVKTLQVCDYTTSFIVKLDQIQGEILFKVYF